MATVKDIVDFLIKPSWGWDFPMMLGQPSETAPEWFSGNPGSDPNNIGPYRRDENGEWWEYQGDPEGDYDPYWLRPVDDNTQDMLDEISDRLKNHRPWFNGPAPVPGDANGNGIPDILEGARKKFGDARSAPPDAPPRVRWVDPLILDLDGDGVETTAVNTGTYFDHDGNGFAESTGWVGADDGLLVRDVDGSGWIDTGAELFGNHTRLANGRMAANGFEALSDLDSIANGGNADGKLDASDAAWAGLKVWRDADGDGYHSAGEVITLDEAGVQSINVGYTTSTQVDANGNAHSQIGSYTTTDNQTRTATDVWFQTDKMNTLADDWLEVPDDIAAMPDIRGFGNVYSLQQAMVRNVANNTTWRIKA